MADMVDCQLPEPDMADSQFLIDDSQLPGPDMADMVDSKAPDMADVPDKVPDMADSKAPDMADEPILGPGDVQRPGDVQALGNVPGLGDMRELGDKQEHADEQELGDRSWEDGVVPEGYREVDKNTLTWPLEAPQIGWILQFDCNAAGGWVTAIEILYEGLTWRDWCVLRGHNGGPKTYAKQMRWCSDFRLVEDLGS